MCLSYEIRESGVVMRERICQLNAVMPCRDEAL